MINMERDGTFYTKVVMNNPDPNFKEVLEITHKGEDRLTMLAEHVIYVDIHKCIHIHVNV